MGTERELRAALVGCGEISKAHLAAIDHLDGVVLCGAVDLDRRRAERIARHRPGVIAHTTVEEMLRVERPDVVHVLTPPATHARIAELAAEAGSHVLVEKPFALTESDARRVVDAATANGVLASVCHNMVCKPSVEEARRLVEAGAIGDVLSVSSFWGAIGVEGAYAGPAGSHWAWRLPGGVFTNFLPHLISLEQAFIGDTPSVTGVALAPDPRDPGRPSELLVALQSGTAVGSMALSLLAQPKASFVDVVGSRGTIRVDLVREVCILLPRRTAPGPLGKLAYAFDHARQLSLGSVRSAAYVVSGRWGGNPGMPRLVDGFYRSVRTGEPPPIAPADAVAASALLEAVLRADPRLTERPRAAPPAAPEHEAPADIAGLPARAFVTGASGFLGQHLARALHGRGVPVVALVRDPGRMAFELEDEATIARGDLSDVDDLAAAMTGCDVVFHCAAITGNQGSLAAAMEDNAGGTERVCQAAAKAGVRRVVHVSSVVVYGVDHPAGTVVDERWPLRAGDDFSSYQRSKVAAEAAARRVADDLGLELVIVRPGVLHGPGHPIRTGLVGIGRSRVGIGRGRNRMPFTYVDNAVDALLLAASVPAAAGEAFNVVDDPQRRVRDVLRVLEPAARPVPIPVPVALAAAGWLERRRRDAGLDAPKLSRFTVRSASRDVVYDATKAHEVLGWAPRVSLEEAVRRSSR